MDIINNMEKHSELWKKNISIILILSFILIGSLMIVYNVMQNILSSAEISETLGIRISGIDSKSLENINVYITSFKGVDKPISKINNSNLWEKENHWVKKIWIIVPKEYLKNITEIKVSLGKKDFIFDQNKIDKEWLKNETKDKIFLTAPVRIRAENSRVGPLNNIINWPGDFVLISKSLIASSGIILLLILIFILLRKIIFKGLEKILDFSYARDKSKNILKIIRAQYIAILLILIVVLVFYPPGQGNRGSIKDLKTLLIYFYYIILNFLSIYNKNFIFNILQFVLGLFFVFMGFRTIINKDKREDSGEYFKLLFFILIILVLTSFIIHFNNRNIHFQEADSSVVYPAIYNFPSFAYQFSSDFYSPKPWLKGVKDYYIDKIFALNLPHFLKSFFALPFGSTYSPGVGLIYGLVSESNTNFGSFISNSVIITLLFFHITIILVFLLLINLKVKPFAAVITSLIFMFSISMYSYAYSLYGVVWNVFTGFLWLLIVILSYNNKRFFTIVSVTTGILIFFNYLIVFYWVAFVLAHGLSYKKDMEKEEYIEMMTMYFMILFLIAILLGVLGFAPSRHILFLSPFIFLLIGFGLNKIIKNKRQNIFYILLVLGLIVCLGFVSLNSNLKDSYDQTLQVKVTQDIDKIIIQDSSYELLYRDWNIKRPVEFSNPNDFELNKTYLYVSQTTKFEEAYDSWKTIRNIKIESLESYSNVTDIYFIAYNPYPEQFKHNRPNNVFYEKFRIISMD